MIAVLIVPLAALSLWAAWRSFRPGDPVPLSASSFLRDVVEPIAIVGAMSFDDGGKGIRFKDAQGVERDVCLAEPGLERFSLGDPDADPVLVLDSFFPTGDRAWRVPISGPEERAVLGLLDRWAAADSDAQELERRHDLLARNQLTIDDFWAGMPEKSRLKEPAVSILRVLRSRN